LCHNIEEFSEVKGLALANRVRWPGKKVGVEKGGRKALDLAMRVLPLVLLTTFSFGFGGSTVFAQGSLTPPGAPGPLFKTLSQVEPRTPISAPTVISNSGSYYMTTNIVVTNGNTTAINITANDVTVDLNGFSLVCTATNGSGDGVNIGGVNNVWIRNGSIVSFANGVRLLTQARGIRIEDMYLARSRENGISGFFLASPSTGMVHIARCIVEDMGLPAPTTVTFPTGIILQGIPGVIEDCTIRDIRSGLTGPGVGMFLVQVTNSIALRNKLIQCPTGMSMAAGVAFRDNISIGCTTPFSGGTNKGNNN